MGAPVKKRNGFDWERRQLLSEVLGQRGGQAHLEGCWGVERRASAPNRQGSRRLH